MLVRCQELREPVKDFQRKYRQVVKVDKEFHVDDSSSGAHYNPMLDALTDDEWLEVINLIDFLKIPYDLTEALEGNNSNSGFGSLWQTIINLQTLWQHYDTAGDTFDNNDTSYLNSAINYGLAKLDIY